MADIVPQETQPSQPESTPGLKSINVKGNNLLLYTQINDKNLSTGTTLLLQRVDKKAFDNYNRLLNARGLPAEQYSAQNQATGEYNVTVGVYSGSGQFTPIYDHLLGTNTGVSAVDSEFKTQIDKAYNSTLTGVKKDNNKRF